MFLLLIEFLIHQTLLTSMDTTMIAMSVIQLFVSIRVAYLGIKALASGMPKEEVWAKKIMHYNILDDREVFRKFKLNIKSSKAAGEATIAVGRTEIDIVVSIQLAAAAFNALFNTRRVLKFILCLLFLSKQGCKDVEDQGSQLKEVVLMNPGA